MNDSPGRNSPGPSPSDEQPPIAPEQPTDTNETPRADQAAVHTSQWAGHQPPPHRWSPPMGGPAQPPGQGWDPGWNNGGPTGGSPGGWGGHQWTPPPRAPQPGVIPLRPLGVGEVLQGAIQTTLRYWRPALGISALVAVATQALVTITSGLWLRHSTQVEELKDSASPREVLNALGSSLSTMTIAMAIGLIGSIIATALLTVVVSRAVMGRPTSISEAWQDARPRLLRMGGLLCLLPALVMGTFVLAIAPGCALYAAGATWIGGALAGVGGLAGIAGVTWIWIRYCLAAPALMLEKQGVLASLRRSAKLVRGSWWRIFGVQLLAILVVFAATMIIEIPTSIIEWIFTGDLDSTQNLSWTSLTIAGVGAAVSSALALPITAGVTALLYVDQRIRQESLDLELIRANDEQTA